MRIEKNQAAFFACHFGGLGESIRGHAKFMGYTGLVQMGYRARTTHINNGAGTFFRKHIYGENSFLFIFMNYFLH